MKKGSAELLILSVIEARPRHGYDVARLIEQRSGGELTFHAASLYPLLYRLEQRGWISGRWTEKAGERRRRMYRLTPAGRKVLVRQRSVWRAFAKAIDRSRRGGTCLSGPVAFANGSLGCVSIRLTEAETIEELAQHVDDRYRDLLARGATEDDAEARAWRELDGHPLLAREISSARVSLTPAPIHNTSRGGFHAVLDDAGFAWRRLRHSPGFAIVALLTVTLAVGANTAILSVADAVLFRPLPYADPDGVAIIQIARPQERPTVHHDALRVPGRYQ